MCDVGPPRVLIRVRAVFQAPHRASEGTALRLARAHGGRMRISKLLACFFGGVAVATGLAAFGAPEGGAQGNDVTLRVERFYDSACRCYKLRFSGTIASGQANEYVVVLRQECGAASSTAFAGASTRAGGVWESEPVMGARPESDSSTYRARWNGRLSEPLVFRGKLLMSLTKLGGGRYRVRTGTQQNMQGRQVELQRLVSGQWRRVRSARLARVRGGFGAIFTVRRRGLTLRVLVPVRSAAPCFSATASEPFVSGATSGPGSGARVIDRTLLCSVAMRGGIRKLEIQASAATSTGIPSFGAMTNWTPDASLVSATTEGLSLNPTRCTQASGRVPLATEKLQGGATSSSGREFECETPSRVLVRVRGVFRSPATFETTRFFGYPVLSASGEMTEASMAIRTQAGKPLAFASVHESGSARLFGGRGCIEDET
jgi:hypothetical protein